MTFLGWQKLVQTWAFATEKVMSYRKFASVIKTHRIKFEIKMKTTENRFRNSFAQRWYHCQCCCLHVPTFLIGCIHTVNKTAADCCYANCVCVSQKYWQWQISMVLSIAGYHLWFCTTARCLRWLCVCACAFRRRMSCVYVWNGRQVDNYSSKMWIKVKVKVNINLKPPRLN